MANKFVKQKELPEQKQEARLKKVAEIKISPKIQPNDLKVKINKAVIKTKKNKSNKIQLIIEGSPEDKQKAKSTLLAFQQISASFQMIPQGDCYAVIADEHRKDKQEEVFLDEIFDEEDRQSKDPVRGVLIVKQNFTIETGQLTGKRHQETAELELDLEMMKKVDALLKKKKQIGKEIYMGLDQYEDYKVRNKKQTFFDENFKEKLAQASYNEAMQQQYSPYEGREPGDYELAKFRVEGYQMREVIDPISILRNPKKRVQKKIHDRQKQRPTKQSLEEDRVNEIKFKSNELTRSFQKSRRIVDQSVQHEDDKNDILKHFDKNSEIFKNMKKYFKVNNLELNNKNVENYMMVKMSNSLEELRALENRILENQN